MNRQKKWIRSLVEETVPSTELIPGIPLVEICDRTRILVENHQGIIGYGCNEIRIKTRFGSISVCGSNLKLTRMSNVRLVITGRISSVNLQGRG